MRLLSCKEKWRNKTKQNKCGKRKEVVGIGKLWESVTKLGGKFRNCVEHSAEPEIKLTCSVVDSHF